MGAWIDTLHAFSTTLRNVGRPRVTEKLPWKRLRVHPPRYRAGFALTDDEHGEIACIACKACENVCPSQIIRIEAERRDSPVTGKKRAYPASFVLDMNACIFCELCVQVCPSDAIRMRTAWQLPGTSREDQVLTLERLRAHAREGHFSEATSSGLRAMQDPARGTPGTGGGAP